MNTCSVRIELDRDPSRGASQSPAGDVVRPAYTPEDTITGTVHMEVEKPRSDVRVFLSRRWIKGGHGVDYSGGKDEILLFEGDWLEPKTHRFPFIFHVPPGPYSYHGHLVELDWVLDVRVVKNSDEIAHQRRIFVVEASGNEREFNRGEMLPPKITESDLRTYSRRVLLWVGAMILLLAGIALIYPTLAATRGANWGTLSAGLGCLILAGYLGRRSIRRAHAKSPPWWGFAPTRDDYEAEPGDSISFVVELKPNFKTSTHRVTALLRGVEQSWRKRQSPDSASAPPAPPNSAKPRDAAASDATQVERHSFFEEPIEIEPIREPNSPKRAPNTYRVHFRLPSDAPYSFYCPGASISWAIEVHVDVGSWPDWRREFPLVVRPNVSATPNLSAAALRP